MAIPSVALSGFPADHRLRQLGYTVDELHEAAHVGYTAASGCTDHDPRSLPGTLAWAKTIGHLRDIKKPEGFTANRTANFETIVHPTNAHAVAVAAGTADTGRSDATPRTKTPKGPATSAAVRQNLQLPLGHGTDVFAGQGVAATHVVVDDHQRQTWFFLHYFDRKAEEIRLEVSCPSEMKGDQITSWRERIVLPPLPFASDVDIDIDDEDDDIEIDVTRKVD
jgi:hypothetical protein